MTEKGPDIFLSYRRTNHRLVDHLHEKFTAEFRAGSVFLDRLDIEPGTAFPDRLRDAVEQCSVLLAIIDRTWLSVQDERTLQRRLDMPDDWVRQELELALSKGKLIVPVLVEGMGALKPEQLPPTLRPLSTLQAVTITDTHFGTDVGQLIANVKQWLVRGWTTAPVKQIDRFPTEALIKPSPLATDVLERLLEQLSQWKLVRSTLEEDSRFGAGYQREEIRRDFMFDSFLEAIEFMRQVATRIDAADHHPRWENVFKTVTVYYTTFDIGHRISDRDYKNAMMVERSYREFMMARQ